MDDVGTGGGFSKDVIVAAAVVKVGSVSRAARASGNQNSQLHGSRELCEY